MTFQAFYQDPVGWLACSPHCQTLELAHKFARHQVRRATMNNEYLALRRAAGDELHREKPIPRIVFAIVELADPFAPIIWHTMWPAKIGKVVAAPHYGIPREAA